MTISIESKIAHPSCAKVSTEDRQSVKVEELKNMFENVLKEKNEFSPDKLKWLDEKTVQVDELSGLSLHSFLLKVEELGKDVTFTKKTVIEIQ